MTPPMYNVTWVHCPVNIKLNMLNDILLQSALLCNTAILATFYLFNDLDR